MVDEDTQGQVQDAPANDDIVAVKSQMQQLQEQLAQMNEQYRANMQSVVDAVTKSQSQISNTDDQYLTDEEKQIKALRAEIEEIKNSTPRQTQEILKRERDLNNTVVKLAQDYPEIQSDAKIRQAVLDQHAKLPQGLKETAEGYELAVQRAVAQAGLIPKSRRTSSSDADSYVMPGSKGGSSSSQSQSGRKPKVSEKTLLVAQLLGRDIKDEKVLKGLEAAAQREFNKYR